MILHLLLHMFSNLYYFYFLDEDFLLGCTLVVDFLFDCDLGVFLPKTDLDPPPCFGCLYFFHFEYPLSSVLYLYDTKKYNLIK